MGKGGMGTGNAHEKMRAAAAPRKPKKGAVSSPLKVEPAMGSRRPGKRGEDGRGQAQATMIQPLLVAGARSDSLALLSLALSVDSSNRQKKKRVTILCVRGLMG